MLLKKYLSNSSIKRATSHSIYLNSFKQLYARSYSKVSVLGGPDTCKISVHFFSDNTIVRQFTFLTFLEEKLSPRPKNIAKMLGFIALLTTLFYLIADEREIPHLSTYRKIA